MTQIAESAHGNKSNPDTPYALHGCESCHGAGSLHSSKARGGVGFPPLIAFRQWESTEEQNDACMSCHGKELGGEPGMEWAGSLHQLRGMTCAYCHQVHSVHDKMKDQETQKQSCSRCHSKKTEAHRKIQQLLDSTKCSECHDPHSVKHLKRRE
jgi:hypothetical protein